MLHPFSHLRSISHRPWRRWLVMAFVVCCFTAQIFASWHSVKHIQSDDAHCAVCAAIVQLGHAVPVSSSIITTQRVELAVYYHRFVAQNSVLPVCAAYDAQGPPAV